MSRLPASSSSRLLNLAQRLHQRVVGQDEAVQSVCDAVLRSRAGLARCGKLMGSFLFVGSMGAGKTELAKALAYELFDDDKHLVRFDMAKYTDEDSVAGLIGAPPGHMGHEHVGQLLEAVHRNPHQVILLDEIEKAHPKVVNLLLVMLNDGRLRDSYGCSLDISNVVLILTSSIGVEHLQFENWPSPGANKKAKTTHPNGTDNRGSSQTYDLAKERADAVETGHETKQTFRQQRELVLQKLRHTLRPDLLDRLDEIVVFEPLGRQELRQIVLLQLDSVVERLKKVQVRVNVTESALDVILDASYEPQYGAHPIKRYIEKHVVTELSRLIVSHQLEPKSHVQVIEDSGTLSFAVYKPTDSDTDTDTETGMVL